MAAHDDRLPVDSWEGHDAEELARRWSAPEVRLYSSVDSTNDVARELAAQGAPTGSVVVADAQRRGRGRVGRSWSSPAGLGLWFSVVARPSARILPLLPVRVGLAISKALDPWTAPDRARVKWPNDLLLDHRKLGGVLSESSWAGDSIDHAIVGVGLNLLHSDNDFPAEIRRSAIALASATGVRVRTVEVADAVIPAVLAAVSDETATDLSAVLKSLATRDALLGKMIEVREPETGRTIAAGEGAGIDASGALLVQGRGGRQAVRSGTVRLVEEEG